MSLFKDSLESIRSFYRESPALREKDWGGRFLYCDSDRLENHNGILVMGYNPGGREKGSNRLIEPQVKNSCAYLAEDWGSPLQDEILALFEGIGKRIGDSSRKGYDLLNETLCTNFIPFRSPRQDLLPDFDKCVNFSRQLWTPILDSIPSFKVALAIGNNESKGHSAYRFLRGYHGQDKVIQSEQKTIRGNFTVKVDYFKDADETTLLVGFPHLGQRGQFIRNDSYRDVREWVLDEIESMFSVDG